MQIYDKKYKIFQYVEATIAFVSDAWSAVNLFEILHVSQDVSG